VAVISFCSYKSIERKSEEEEDKKYHAALNGTHTVISLSL